MAEKKKIREFIGTPRRTALPLTPVKKTPYRDIFQPNIEKPRISYSDGCKICVHTAQNILADKIGEGDFFEVFARSNIKVCEDCRDIPISDREKEAIMNRIKINLEENTSLDESIFYDSNNAITDINQEPSSNFLLSDDTAADITSRLLSSDDSRENIDGEEENLSLLITDDSIKDTKEVLSGEEICSCSDEPPLNAHVNLKNLTQDKWYDLKLKRESQDILLTDKFNEFSISAEDKECEHGNTKEKSIICNDLFSSEKRKGHKTMLTNNECDNSKKRKRSCVLCETVEDNISVQKHLSSMYDLSYDRSKEICMYKSVNSAVKRTKRILRNHLEKSQYLREVEILKNLKCDNIISYISSWIFDDRFYIETEYCNAGTLRDYLDEVIFTKNESLPSKTIKKIMLDLSLGLEEIHRKNIVHLDIKPENIFIKTLVGKKECQGRCNCDYPTEINDLVFKIGDFNISRYVTENIEEDGDRRYMAPEILLNVFVPRSDVYSLGVIYLEMTLGCLPGDYEEKDYINDFIARKMVEKDFKKRFTSEEVACYFKS